ncbi:YwiC-like family protein [Paenibacillus polygoni]|uniref:YwiC-like family protein n=1 Tax=Paenibacillus polygoni TaxID=3050112 RepID=A0ABY8X428_9BACL|nr:YwiC-like family protein [Paenibacillus polygoni]WIV20286.1 YwiC-like family protein [Paenibacillus polygoni]
MKQNKIVIPHEHGGWAMISVPFLFGVMAGTPRFSHILLFIAWLFLYLASYPLLQAIKRKKQRTHLLKYAVIYGVIAIAALLYPLIDKPQLFYFGIPFLILLSVNIWHVKKKAERAILNDFCAIVIFSLGGAASYLYAGGSWDAEMLTIVLYNLLYFMGTALFVKTIFRERGNSAWEKAAKIYHILILFIPFILGQPWMVLPYIFPLVRAFLYAGKSMKPMKAGILEVIGALQFIIISWFVY